MVYEKALSYGNQGALFGDIKAALYAGDKRPAVENFIVGLGGREIRTETLYDTLKQACRGIDKDIDVDDEPQWVGLADG